MLCSLTLTDVVWGGLFTPMYVRLRVIELLDGKACSIRKDGDSPLMAVSFSICLFSTLGSLGVMSVDRYLAVAKPVWYKTTVTRQHATFASGSVWLTSMTLAILPQVNIFPHQVVKIFEGSFSIIFSCLIIIFQILSLVTPRKHNKAVAQVMEESARANLLPHITQSSVS